MPEILIDFLMGRVFPWLIIGAVCFLLLLIPVALYDTFISEHISIKKDDWQCVSYRSYYYPGYMVGKVYNAPRVSRECETYHKREDR